ncbi:MAG TPA: hypothetical protein VGR81_11560 [Candidatus Acidoferrales bacterium]|nr:hypothetical protein [Candidatus Acidoferrales bacterium]
MSGFALAVFLLSISIAPRAPNCTAVQATPDNATASETIVLPLELVANQPATLAVLSADGHVMAAVKLVLSSGETITTDESGRAHFLAPPETGVLYVRTTDSEVRAVTDVLPPGAAVNRDKISVPFLVALKNPFSIRGRGFYGDADHNSVEIVEQPALVLAASPLELIVLPSPQITPGIADLVLKSASDVPLRITLVDVASDASELQVRPGEKIQLSLRVNGTAQAVGLKIRNLSPQIAQFKLKRNQTLKTSGGVNNSAKLEVKGLRAGQFSFRAELAPSPGAPDVVAARDFLEAAQKIAPENQRHSIASILKELRPQAIHVAGARKKVEKLFMSSSPGDFSVLLEAARRALLGD